MAPETLGVLTSASAPARRPLAPSSESSGTPVPSSHALELALMRRSLAGLADTVERCGRCARTMLIGERVYEYASGQIRCELCRERERQTPEQSHTVHGPEFGHSIRVRDRRGARAR